MTGTPRVVAHRAGNRLDLLADAIAAGVDVIELDVHPYRGRLEVRHTKTFGPRPILWEKWFLADGLAPALHLEEVLAVAAAHPSRPTLMIDMKGGDPRLPRMLLRGLRDWPAERGLLACSRAWWNLTAFADDPVVTPVHSAGSPRQLRRLLARFSVGGPHILRGVSVHKRLLDPETVAALRARTPLVLSWPVNTAADARRLACWGVTGLITDAPADLGLAGHAPP